LKKHLNNKTMKKNQVNKYYFDNPEIWERVNISRFNNEPNFLQKIFEKYGKVKSVLDVGCGTGSHLNKLSKMGFDVFGIDLNKNMIKYARKHYPHIEFKVADMRKFSLSKQFDSVICLATTFCYNTTNENVVSTLKSFYNILKKDGILITETFNPVSWIEKERLGKIIEEREAYQEFGLKSVREYSVDEVRQQLIEKRTIYKLGENKKLKSDLTKFRMFFPQEMKHFLETSGFKFQNFYGSYNIDDKKLEKIDLITVSKKSNIESGYFKKNKS